MSTARSATRVQRDHRCEQVSGWLDEQPEPGVIRWTLPAHAHHHAHHLGHLAS
jgi:hypothetical protein